MTLSRIRVAVLDEIRLEVAVWVSSGSVQVTSVEGAGVSVVGASISVSEGAAVVGRVSHVATVSSVRVDWVIEGGIPVAMGVGEAITISTSIRSAIHGSVRIK